MRRTALDDFTFGERGEVEGSALSKLLSRVSPLG